MFDVDRDGVLSRDELHEMVVALLEVWKDNRTDLLPVSKLTLSHNAHNPPERSRVNFHIYAYWNLTDAQNCALFF